ncbi:beta-ketoacyl-[acyl-carrier-protein] synthase family protein [Derxia gummosa]|uniref:Beta-ketoacyl-[acyl-carrier-protein] synthase family protein n=1 Tax=Derxia gummosa DSM 723 TaxID=1121388 RepID=A0A8B6X8B5_9BURK|nr:beta-ketoacyl-[acyl-carrier-protein] synthase family protein [Derxia gummosa]
MNRNAVVITGLGVVSPAGQDITRFELSLRSGSSGIRHNTWHHTEGARSQLVGIVDPFEPAAELTDFERRRLSRADQYALTATVEAWQQAALDGIDRDRVGVVFGSGGGVNVTECYVDAAMQGRVGRPSSLLPMNPDSAGTAVARHWGLHGPRTSIMTACSSGATAVGLAADFIECGFADVMVAGGTESLSHVTFTGFNALGALATGRNRPFDRRRDGIVLGEGAGVLILERAGHALARGVKPLAVLAGYGITSDASHITAPHPEGDGMARAMQLALRKSGLAAERIGYINAHGTGTSLNDKSETAAIRRVFGAAADRLAVSSIKPMIGHTLSAAGAIEAVATVLGLMGQFLPPTLNFEEADPDCDLDVVPNVARNARLDVAMKNSLAFGGNNTSLILARPEAFDVAA